MLCGLAECGRRTGATRETVRVYLPMQSPPDIAPAPASPGRVAAPPRPAAASEPVAATTEQNIVAPAGPEPPGA